MENKKQSDITKNHPIVTGLLMSILMLLTLGLGIVIAPMLDDLIKTDESTKKTSGSADSHDHSAHQGTPVSDENGQWYVCPMHPWIVQPEMGICPICQMDLTPLDPSRFSNEVSIDPVIVQNIGVRLASVVERSSENGIRTVGFVEANEKRTTSVNLKFSGWVEKVFADSEGEFIRKGSPLLEIYSPELLSAKKDYQLIYNSGDFQKSLLAKAASKLKLFDLTDQQIVELQTRDEVPRLQRILSPASGYIFKKTIFSGQKITPGNSIYQIVDLSQVWVMAKIYQQQLSSVKVGQNVDISLQGSLSGNLSARVDYIYPTVDQVSREAKIRIEVNNRNGKLKPGMYVDIDLKSESENLDKLMVPEEAVMRTGERTIAFVSLGEGRFEPRDITIGEHTSDGFIEVNSGLRSEEKVVISGQFLIDSEAKIRESLLKMIKGDQASGQAAVVNDSGHGATILVSEDTASALADLLSTYLLMQNELFENSNENISNKAAIFAIDLEYLLEVGQESQPEFWTNNQIITTLVEHADLLQNSTDIKQARIRLAYIGHSLSEILKQTGLPDDSSLQLIGVQCGMFPDTPEKGIWLQPEDSQVQNPFYGKDSPMEQCSVDKWKFPEAEEK